MSTSHIGKYACLEVERRYLLQSIPPQLASFPPDRLITDHYLPGTRLRLRRVEIPATGRHIFKLTQKFRSPAQSSLETTITNLYLTHAEYNLLRPLGGLQISKARYLLTHADLLYGIDVFQGPLTGLILAEIECQTSADALILPHPPFPAIDVTDDPAFTGGSLAILPSEDLPQLLSTCFS